MATSDNSGTAANRSADGAFRAAAPDVEGASGQPQPGAGVLPVEERPPDTPTVLARLRRTYTPLGWAIVFDGRAVWTALHTGAAPIRAGTPIELRAAIDATRALAGPYSGERS